MAMIIYTSSMEERNYIKKMTHARTSLEKLYDKLIPMCRLEARSEHRAVGQGSAIKKVNKEIEIMKCKARAYSRDYRRLRNKRLDNTAVDIAQFDEAL